MNKHLKLGLTIVVSIIIGLVVYREIQSYIIVKHIQNFMTGMTDSLNKSAEKSQKRIQQQRVEAARQKAVTEQLNLEKNLLCAKNVDTNKCTCFDKRTHQSVSMSTQQCNDYVDSKFSRH